MRVLLSCAAALAALAATGDARAQATGTIPISPTDVRFEFFRLDAEGSRRDLNLQTDLDDLLSIADCQCGQPLQVEITIDNAGAATDEEADIWVGTGCGAAQDVADLESRCAHIASIDLESFITRSQVVAIDVPPLIDPSPAEGGSCETSDSEGTQLVYVLIDQDDDDIQPDVNAVSPAIGHDTKPPPGVLDPIAEAGEERVTVSWTIPENDADVDAYQILCVRADAPDQPVFSDREAGFESSLTLDECPKAPLTASLTLPAGGSPRAAGDGGVDDGGVDGGLDGGPPADAGADAGPLPDAGPGVGDGLPAALLAVDPAFVCSGRIDASQTSASVTGLLNGVAYRLAVIAIDAKGNPSAAVDAGTATPTAVEDFFEHYRGAGGAASGFCATAPRGSAAGALTLLALATWWIGRGRPRPGGRRGGRGPAACALLAGGLAALAAGGPARAQPLLTDQPQLQSEQRWALELKFGPYKPDVDDEFGGAATPYADIFGGDDGLLSQLEVDRELWHGHGTLGAGATIGYFHKSGKALLPDGTRSGDSTTLHLLPLVAQAVYRYDVFWERAGLPLVPYAKLGLAYTLWWTTRGDGTVSEAMGDKARGGSFGWQGNLGLAVILDGVDPEGARSLDADLGINHTLFFGELVHADVDSFGRAGALHVGDTTWLLGLAFEF